MKDDKREKGCKKKVKKKYTIKVKRFLLNEVGVWIPVS
jgi:hypothetical protein